MKERIITIIDKFHLSDDDREEFLNIIEPIYIHPEFQRRFGSEFPHHGIVTVGEHVIEDAIKTYLLSKKYVKKNRNYSLKCAVYIALFHDLYTVPWQNNEASKVNKFRNIHGFRHPVEAVVNSYTWYPEIYKTYGEYKIIDGIIHHMYPLPVSSLRDVNENITELKNYELYKELPDDIKRYLIKSTGRLHLDYYSFCPSKFKEGKVMSRADKYISIRQLKNISDWQALLTGRNKGIKKNQYR